MTNEQIIQKAVITADALASQGKLPDAHADQFLDYTIDETQLKNNARIYRFRNENWVVDKIGVGNRVAVPKAEAVDPQIRNNVTTSKITLTPKEIMIPFEIGDTFMDINLEGDDIEDHIVRMMATQAANNLEELHINGNEYGPATAQSNLAGMENGSSDEVKDTYLALIDGWSQLAESANVLDAAGLNIGHSVFSQAIRTMPTKFRRNMAKLRWLLSPDLWQIYLEKLTTRQGDLAERVIAGGQAPGPFGIPAVPIPLWAFQPTIVEHVTLNGTTAVQLANYPISNVVVHASTLGSTPSAGYTITTDYTLDLTLGTITRVDGGNITDGEVVKVTYTANPQMLLTPMENLIVGIGRDIRIEKDRDIFKGVNQYAITMKTDVEIEEATALVKIKNIGTGT